MRGMVNMAGPWAETYSFDDYTHFDPKTASLVHGPLDAYQF